MIPLLRRYFSPAPPINRLSEQEVRRLYPRYRWRIMESTFLGLFYLVRNNLAPVAKEMEEALQYDHSTIGATTACQSNYGQTSTR
jgi:OPA family glycerol-3-phosphate transporter-like MFS transporter